MGGQTLKPITYKTREEIEALLTSKYGPCEYNDAAHEYKVAGVIVPSITTKKKDIVPAFDGEIIAQKMSDRCGGQTTKQEFLDQWAGVAECGTMLHELLEALLMRGNIQRPTNHGLYNKHAHERFLAYRENSIPSMMLKAF
jgi:hypothetical protein